MLDNIILVVLITGMVPLALAIFYYVTKPSTHWFRVPSALWTQSAVGIQTVAQKTILLLVLGFIWISRIEPDLPGRQIIAFVLYTMIVGAFWSFFLIQRSIQKPYERADKALLKKLKRKPKE